MLQLIHNDEPVQLVRPGGRFTYDGKTVFGAHAGWTQDGYSLVEYVAPEPEPEPAPDTEEVSSRQFKLQLLSDGLLDQVEAWISAQDRATQIAYDNASTFYKNDPMMVAGFTALGFTEGLVTEFFNNAGNL